MMPLPTGDLDDAIDLAEESFRGLRGARMFLTGCTGFFGTWLLETLGRADERLGLGLDLTVLSREPDAFIGRHPHLGPTASRRFLRGDVRSFADPDGRFTHVIHGATTNARETFVGEDPLRKFDTVALGTRRVLEFCAARDVAEMLFVGSGAVYGRRTAPSPILETEPAAPDPLDAGTTLGQAKRAAEHFCAVAGARGCTRIKLARCFSFVGPQLPLDIHYAIGNFIADAVAGRPIAVKGTGLPVRSYLYMSDLVAWLVTILVRGAPLRPYNVGSCHPVTIGGLAALVAEATGGVVAPIGTSAKPPSTAAPDYYVPSTHRVCSELGVQETLSLRDAILRTFHGVEQ
jgi:UDP-glucuronate decarboxylase